MPSHQQDVATELDALPSRGEAHPAPGLVRAWLLVRRPTGIEMVDLGDGVPVTIGRTEEATVRIDDNRVSRRHARLWRAGQALFLEDHGSRNGTLLNGEIVRGEQRRLSGGDVICVADCEAVVALSGAVDVPSRAKREQVAEARSTASRDPEVSPGLLVVADPVMVRTFQIARRIAASEATVLVQGETGAGKEVVSREIHDRSDRSRGPFVRVNCPSLPETLIESELFGYEKGAFTGADKAKIGFVEAANHGTLLLDEIGDLPLKMQVKLLSVIENRCVLHVGGVREIPVDVRILCATHRDLRAEVAAGRFREDLYYRISALTITVPPLRDRPAEILLLAAMFLRQLAVKSRSLAPSISPEAAAALTRHRWPGNVRELRNVMQHAAVMSDAGRIGLEHLPESVLQGASVAPKPVPAAVLPLPAPDASPSHGDMRDQLSDMERRSILEALDAEGGNQTRAAARLGISRRALIYKLHKHGLMR